MVARLLIVPLVAEDILSAILKFPDTKVFAFDRDKLTCKYATILEKKFPKRFNFFQEKFSNLNQVIVLQLKS